MKSLKLTALRLAALLSMSCVTNKNMEQLAIDFVGEETPVMLNGFDAGQPSKEYVYQSGTSSATSTKTRQTAYGSSTTTTTEKSISLSLKKQLEPMLFVNPKFVYLRSIKLYESYIIAVAGSVEKTELTVVASIGGK